MIFSLYTMGTFLWISSLIDKAKYIDSEIYDEYGTPIILFDHWFEFTTCRLDNPYFCIVHN